jgi:choline-glycine betaine transporter
MYDSHDANWIDSWTILYWGWWISWSAFVGMFIARISRGRTIRQLIFGAFLVPTTFSFFWIIIVGSLGIKMQRVAELAPSIRGDFDWFNCRFNCHALGYVNQQPHSAATVALADDG